MRKAGPTHLGKILKRDCLATAQPLQLLLGDMLPKTLSGISLKAEPHALSWHRSQALMECLGGSATKPPNPLGWMSRIQDRI